METLVSPQDCVIACFLSRLVGSQSGSSHSGIEFGSRFLAFCLLVGAS